VGYWVYVIWGLWLCVPIWLMVRLVFIAVVHEKLPRALPALHTYPKVGLVLPARNEAANLERLLKELTAQQYPAAQLAIYVVNDASTDGTGDIARRVAEGLGGAGLPCITVLETGGLPADWMSGKNHACWLGAQAAMADGANYLCFMDADVQPLPHMLQAGVGYAQQHNTALLSLEPHQLLVGFWERVVQLAQMLVYADIMPMNGTNRDDKPGAIANGQFLLFTVEAYVALGTHSAMRNTVGEDMAFARACKTAGRRLRFIRAEHALRCRMYSGLRHLWNGLANTQVGIAGGWKQAALGSARYALFVWGMVLLPLLLPIAPYTVGVWVVGAGLMITVFTGATFYFRVPFYYGLLAPFGLLVQGTITLEALRRHYTKRYYWRGRVVTAQ